MKRAFLLFIFLGLASHAKAQTWSGILKPTSGAGLCTFVPTASPGACGIDWSTAGVPGGIPSSAWTQSGGTISAGASQATIQAALNACGTSHYVLLGAGSFSIATLNIPSNCELRGSGTLTSSGTIINLTGTSGAAFTLGTGGPSYSSPANATITSGATAGSTSIVVSSASGISTGTLLAISEVNDPTYVTINTPNGTCGWCDGTGDGGVRTRGQVVLVTAVSGTTITISPGLYTNYGTASGTGPVLAYYYAASAIRAGIENLQVYSNGTGYSQVYKMTACEYCWIKGVFDNYADGDHADVYWSYHDEIRDSYFSNAYIHGPGATDADVSLLNKTSGTLIENNIFERLHVGIMISWGAAGNVIAYNYEIGNFDTAATNAILAFIGMHGAHPQFNLFEGNVGNNATMDSFWGSGGNNTLFRNHLRATDTIALPTSNGRNVVNWASTHLAVQQLWGLTNSFVHTNANAVGNVFGSVDVASVASLYNGGTAPFTSTMVPPTTRNYNNQFVATTVGYDTGGDSTGTAQGTWQGGIWAGKAAATIFRHGNFDIASNSIIWKSGITQTLPASFYRGAKPSWFGSVPWPPIGPDVTGGNVDAVTLAGHVNSIPAKVCYESTARDVNGLKLFDPNACYVSIAPPTFLYGTGVQTTALNNINVGGPSNWRVAYRFKANYTDTITGGVYYRITSATPGYSGGTLGTIVVTLASDSGGSPGTTLSTCTNANTGFFPAFSCPAAGTTVGQTYYVVFTNTDPSPTVNFASVDGLYDVGGVPDPNFRYTTLINNGSGWSAYPTTEPILQVNYANGHAQGNGYMEVWINNDSTTLTSTTWARELFTPTSPRTVYSVTIGPAAIAGTTVTLSTAAGALIETGTLPARDPTGWATYVFSTPRVLAAGTQYQLILKAAGVAYPIRKGITNGFAAETYFADGHAQFSTDSGATWTNFNDENSNPSTEGDLEFTFLTVPVPNITTLTLPGATQTGAYSTTLAVAGGTAPYTWALNAGTLPAGLSLNTSTGVISGTTSGTGTSTFTVRVTDSAGQTDTQALNIFVALAPAVTTPSLPAATKNLAYSTTLAVTDGTLNCSWSVTVGTLPTGLSLNSTTGAIAGTPTIAGTSSFTVQASDANSVTATKALGITVNAPPVITTTSPLPAATQGTAYTATVSATGGTPPYIWSISGGTLPIGLSINSSSGVISGTPSAASRYNFTVAVTDAATLSSNTPFSMVVNAPPQVTVVTSSLPNGALFTAYGVTVTASAGTTPYAWSVSVGSLPAGLSLNTATGFISGTPTSSGVTNFTMRVVDANSTFDSKALSITVPAPNTTVGAPKGTMP